MGKQFNLKGKNGLYLSYVSTYELNNNLNFDYSDLENYYKYHLIENYDFFPKNQKEANLFDLKNTKFDTNNVGIVGSNAISKSNSNLTFSQISRAGQLILNKKYYNNFTFYFKFTGSDLGSYVYPNFTNTDISTKVLNALRVKIYLQLGSYIQPLKLSGLQKFNGTTWVDVTDSDKSGVGNIADLGGTIIGIQKTTGNNSEECIDMRYGVLSSPLDSGLFSRFSTEGYTFRVNVKSFDFRNSKALNNQDYKIIIKYFNIGVTGAPAPFNESENVELMSNNFTYYQRIVINTYPFLNNPGGYLSNIVDEIAQGGEEPA